VIIGVPGEIFPDEQRVALTPANVGSLLKTKGVEIRVEQGAGEQAGFTDADYESAGAQLVDRDSIFQQAQVILQVQTPGSNTRTGEQDLEHLQSGQILIGMMDPLANPDFARTLADRGITGVALELIPRITRAQAMDVLSSMAMTAGYKAVLLAANRANRMFPMNMTAAGTLNPARVFVMGAGVAGLQACATAKRLGAVTKAYDVREAAQEQILSVGADPVDLNLDTGDAEGSGGYAKEQGEDFLRRQREAMKEVIAEMDVVVTTAAVPGAKSPILVTEEMVQAMKPGSVIVDLAAERGGNCELTQAGENVVKHGVHILGPENVASSLSHHASQMFGKNMENLLNLMLTEQGEITLDFEDQIIQDTVIAHEGDVPQAKMRELLGLPAREQPAAPASDEPASDEEK
jgi:NAD(P) transhydrogenase subunit alpha